MSNGVLNRSGYSRAEEKEQPVDELLLELPTHGNFGRARLNTLAQEIASSLGSLKFSLSKSIKPIASRAPPPKSSSLTTKKAMILANTPLLPLPTLKPDFIAASPPRTRQVGCASTLMERSREPTIDGIGKAMDDGMGYEEDVTVLALKKERVREGEFFWEARHGLTTLDMDYIRVFEVPVAEGTGEVQVSLTSTMVPHGLNILNGTGASPHL
ncbi:hypothetical protein EDD18DRAFT_1107642 [Armillaria luteobubalina]|uniref:Uncharacterized protein n=1 Tax=Armillaria luteobubalina TaxID=153913 RepID=A0AA39Q2F0_9AGAR|nr:hypothetical protein EDD18DRAFT_1107642 [Armillaria luteobubalina]